VATLTATPGASAGDPVDLRLTPGSGFAVLNRAVTGASGSANTLGYRRHIDRATLEVTGTIPPLSAVSTRTVAVVNPTVFYAQAVKDGLMARGIAVSGEAVDLDDVAPEIQVQGPADRRVLITTESPPLRDIATVLMKVSQNLYAETLLKALGAATGGLGTAEGGRTAVRSALDAWRVPRDAYVMYDGSGLSRYNYVTPEALTGVLVQMYRDERHRDAFAATLPVAGTDGTLATRLKRTRAEGNAIAKTGAISNVRALSGFVRSRDGELLVFSILSNDFVIPAATVNWIADLGVEILSNFTRR
jgi:PBP4 family serine-type D-alanyl-D-alanine carboxypeptidase